MIQEDRSVQAVRIIKEWRVHFVHPRFLTVSGEIFQEESFMSLSVMLQQLASGMVVSVEIFVVTLLFFTSAGTSDLLWQNVQESGDTWNCVCLHISYAWNPVNAAIDGCVFRTILYFWNPYFHGIQPDRCVYCIQY